MRKIRDVHIQAFGSEGEADLVDALRACCPFFISLVYDKDNALPGSIIFSPAELLPDNQPRTGILGLGPMAVVPARQKKGIGSALIKAGIAYCQDMGYDAIVVPGHPDFYPRFGFVPSARYGIRSEYDVPDEVFMILILNEKGMKGRQGTIRHHSAFGSL